MQLTLRSRLAAAACAATGVALAPIGPARAGIEDQDAALRFGWFGDSDGISVVSRAGSWRIALENALRFDVEWDQESVTVPGVTAAPGSAEALDSISGASRPIGTDADPYADFVKTRNQLRSALTWGPATAGYYVSDESDYFAQQVSGGWRQAMFDENLTLDLGASWGWDDIQPAEDADTETVPDSKRTWHLGLVATQVLTPTTIVQGGWERGRVSGLQHNPYRTVWTGTGYEAELHPDGRDRWDVFVKLNQYLPFRASVKGDWKWYADDWGVTSTTIGAKVHQYVGDAVIVRHRYRWYSQGAADFWRDEYTTPGGVDGYRSVDYRLSSYTAHLFGTKLTWDLGATEGVPRVLRDLDWTFKIERYFNSRNFSANILESGLAFSF